MSGGSAEISIISTWPQKPGEFLNLRQNFFFLNNIQIQRRFQKILPVSNGAGPDLSSVAGEYLEAVEPDVMRVAPRRLDVNLQMLSARKFRDEKRIFLGFLRRRHGRLCKEEWVEALA